MRQTEYLPCIFEEGSWADFSHLVEKAEPELFRLINQINPDKSYKLIKATYLYGEKITDLGTICVPNAQGNLVKLDDASVSAELKESLGYCPTPLILQLSAASEVFVETFERIMPLNLFTPGDLYGLFEALVPLTGCPMTPYWSVTSGARSVFLLARVSDAIGHNRLKAEFNLSAAAPKRLSEQWNVIKQIARHPTAGTPWSSEVLIFTKKWFSRKEDDIDWLRFHYYLLVKSWFQSKNVRSKISYDSMLWEHFAVAICAKNLKPNSYIVDTVKHLMLIAEGSSAGFSPLVDEKLMLPKKLIEKAYVDVYGLKDYAPIVMAPWLLEKGGDIVKRLYYSLSYPTLLEGTPSIRKVRNIMTELREVKEVMALLLKTLKTCKEKIYETKTELNFEYYHSDEDRYGEIFNTKKIPCRDEVIQSILDDTKKLFPTHGQFLRGCISVTA